MSLKNCDNKTWLSSNSYIKSFNKFLIKETKLNKNSAILDIGCGRGKILGSLSSRLKLKNKPIGIDIEKHLDRDKRINFKKVDATNYLKNNKIKFDLILIKQTIHLLQFNEIKRLLVLCKETLNPGGKIIIFSLNTNQNEIPTFLLMKRKLKKSLNRDKKIIQFILNLNFKALTKKFSFKVNITKKKYIKMIENRYISTLLSFKSNEIDRGIKEINDKLKKNIIFRDKLICLILNN